MKPFLTALFIALLCAPAADDAAEVSMPVAISSDRRSFVDAAGRPCFWLGDTEWELFRSFTVEDAERLLEERRTQGFNAIQVMLLGVRGGRKPNVAGAMPFLNDTVSTPNEPYFAAVDAIVQKATQLGLVLVIGPYHKTPDAGMMITVDNARAWGTWVGARYRAAPNIIWSMFPVASAAYVPVVRELAAGLAQGDGGRHLITVHPDPSPASSSWIHDEPWLAFNTIQTARSTYLNYAMVAADYARAPVKPVVNGEARYEVEGGTTPLMVRHGAWWSCLAGGFYSYGHGGNWMKPDEWQNWIDSPAARQMKILGEFFRGLDWWTLVPDQTVLAGTDGEVVAARSADHRWIIVYLPISRAVTVILSGMKSGLSLTAAWTNPATGQTVPAGNPPAAGRQTFTPPAGWEDALLLIRAR